jgi:hypothetical protein
MTFRSRNASPVLAIRDVTGDITGYVMDNLS